MDQVLQVQVINKGGGDKSKRKKGKRKFNKGGWSSNQDTLKVDDRPKSSKKEEEGPPKPKETREDLIRGSYNALTLKHGDILQMNVGLEWKKRRK